MKESALTQQSDCKWVRALDSNGNSILISKEDLASVVGGLLPEATATKSGIIKGFVRLTNTQWRLIVIPSSYALYDKEILLILSSFENQPSGVFFMSLKRYNSSSSPGFEVAKLSKAYIDKNYGVKIKYKISSNNLSVWIFGKGLMIVDDSLPSEPQLSEPDDDAIDVDLNA